MDRISLCLSLTRETGLYMPLLLPLMLSYDSVISGKTDKYSEGSLDVKLSLEFYDYSMNDSLKKVCGIGEAASNYYRVSKFPFDKLRQSSGRDIFHQKIAQISDFPDQLSKPGNYEKLLNTVGRYKSLNP